MRDLAADLKMPANAFDNATLTDCGGIRLITGIQPTQRTTGPQSTAFQLSQILRNSGTESRCFAWFVNGQCVGNVWHLFAPYASAIYQHGGRQVYRFSFPDGSALVVGQSEWGFAYYRNSELPHAGAAFRI